MSSTLIDFVLPNLAQIWSKTTIPMQMRLIISTVLGAILNPVLSSEKYLALDDPFLVDILINVINTCNIHLLIIKHHFFKSTNYSFFQAAQKSCRIPAFRIRQYNYNKQVNLEDMANRTTLLFVLISFLLLNEGASLCHYSCAQCTQQSYYACLSCPNNQSVSLQITSQQNAETGTCADVIDNQVNLLGIGLLMLVIIACVLVPNQNICYFAVIFQTLGLLYFIQAYWIIPLDYLLQSFTYLMVLSYITYPLKSLDNNFSQKSTFKAIFYLKTADIKQNLNIIGPIILAITILLIGIPIFKICRKNLAKGEHSLVPDWLLEKVTVILNTTFLFIIQQASLVISMSLLYSMDSQGEIGYIFLAVYILIFLLYFINICKYPLAFFRNKTSQCVCILLKALAPALLLITVNFSFFFFIFVAILFFVQTIATNKNPDGAKKNKLLLYKFLLLVVFLSTFIYYLILRLSNKQKSIQIVGIIATLFLGIFIYIFIVQLFLSLKEKFCDHQTVTEVIQHTQECAVANLGQVEQKGKVFAAERILQSNGAQNESLHVINYHSTQPQLYQTSLPPKKLKKQLKEVTFLVPIIQSQNKSKQILKRAINASQNTSYISQEDACSIFVPQIENFIDEDEEKPKKSSIEESKNLSYQ